MGAGDAYTQAAGATNINGGGTLAGIVDVTGGAVNVVSGGTLAGTANVTGGSLDGNGIVVGTVNDNSGGHRVRRPRLIGTPGVLTVNGNYDQSGTGDLEANLGAGGTTSGVVADTRRLRSDRRHLVGQRHALCRHSVLTVTTFGAGRLAGQFAAIQDGFRRRRQQRQSRRRNVDRGVLQQRRRQHPDRLRINNSSLATSYNWTRCGLPTGTPRPTERWAGAEPGR